MAGQNVVLAQSVPTFTYALICVDIVLVTNNSQRTNYENYEHPNKFFKGQLNAILQDKRTLV